MVTHCCIPVPPIFDAPEPKPITMRCHLHPTANDRISTASVIGDVAAAEDDAGETFVGSWRERL